MKTTTKLVMASVLALFISSQAMASIPPDLTSSFDLAFKDTTVKQSDYFAPVVKSFDRMLNGDVETDNFYHVRISFVKMLGESLAITKADRRSVDELAYAGWEDITSRSELEGWETTWETIF